jgi:CRISPR-associated endonuclease/helicase Cas3
MNCVDVSFTLQGTWVPRDHGYALYAALSQRLPILHEASWLAVHPISGAQPDEDRLHLNRSSRLHLRLRTANIGAVMPLCGSELELQGRRVTIGVPTIFPLVPSPSLDARVIMVKITDAPMSEPNDTGPDKLAKRYEEELVRQLLALNIRKPLSLKGRVRMVVAGRVLIGYSARVTGLSEVESYTLLENGLGGKQRMGCGVFRPTRGATQP